MLYFTYEPYVIGYIFLTSTVGTIIRAHKFTNCQRKVKDLFRKITISLSKQVKVAFKRGQGGLILRNAISFVPGCKSKTA